MHGSTELFEIISLDDTGYKCVHLCARIETHFSIWSLAKYYMYMPSPLNELW